MANGITTDGSVITPVALKHYDSGKGVAYPPGAYDPSALLTGAQTSGAGPATTIVSGGDYIWAVEGTFNGATASLQRLALDGTTWIAATALGSSAPLTMTAPGSMGLVVARGAVLRAVITGGPPANLFSSIAGLH